MAGSGGHSWGQPVHWALPGDPTPENEARAFRLVEEMNRSETGGEVVETHVGRPSAERATCKDELRALLERPRTARKMREAEQPYDRYVDPGNEASLTTTAATKAQLSAPQWSESCSPSACL